MLKSGFYASILCSAFMAFSVNAEAQKAEIFVGNDQGLSQSGIIYDVSEGENVVSFPTKDFQPGAYLLSVRIQNTDGKWTPTVSRMFLITAQAGLSGAEYFIDSDPGTGKGLPICISNGNPCEFVVHTGSLEVGVHTLTVRTLSSTGSWDSSLSRTFLVTGNSVEIEWFFDSDPGIGMGNHIAAESGLNAIMLPTGNLPAGAHIVSFRIKDAKNRWTPTTTHPLYVTEPTDDIVAGEYFVDEDPGEGNGTTFTLDKNGGSSFAISTDNLEEGAHTLSLRGLTSYNKWIPLHVAPFEVKSQAGVNEVEWKMNFDISREGSAITLVGQDIPSGSTVDLCSISGVILHHGTWEDTCLPYVVNPGTSEKNIIVMITTHDGLKAIRRIR